MRCIHYVGRISASSVSSRPFSNSFLPLHVAGGCYTPSATSVGHPGGEFISFECGKGDKLDLCAWESGTFKGWGTSANKPGWMCSYHIGSDVGCTDWKSPQWLKIFFFNFTILYWFCHISTWICHRYTCVPHPEPYSLPIPSLWVVLVYQPQASSIVHRTGTGDSFQIWYYTCFNAILPNHPTLSLSHRVQKTVYIHQCLLCCLVYRVIVTIFLNSIYMC